MKHDTHTQWVMKDMDSFYIRLCACGVIHLCFGSTTINLTSEALIAVSETLKEITPSLRQKHAPISTPLPDNVIPGNFNVISQE